MFDIRKLFKKNKIIEKIDKKNCYICGYDYDALRARKEFYFATSINENDMKYFKYINRDATIKFTGNHFDNIFNCIKVLYENNIKNIKILIFENNDKKKFDDYLNNNNIKDIFNNVTLQIYSNIVNIKTYINCEKVLNNIIKPVLDLSPIEKFIYAYNVTKHFKEYKEDKNDLRNSRDLYKVLNNEYSVCVGFCLLLIDLLDKLNIKSINLSTDLYDEKNLDGYLDGHMRVYVYLKDDKYGIDGFYLSDPTFDNNLIKDNYNFILFTDKQSDYSLYPELLNEHLLFNSSNILEFNRNYDICLKRLNKKDRELLKYIIDVLIKFDPIYIKEIRVKFPIIRGNICIYVDDYNYKVTNELKNELGNYIVNKVNKDIDKEMIKDAIRVIYEKFYGFKDNNKMYEYLENVWKYNEEREYKVYPLLEKNKRYVKKLK